MKVLQWVYDAEEVDAEVMWKQFQKYGLQHMKSVPSTAETINVLETIYNYKRKGHTYFKEHYDKALAARGYQAGVNHRKIKIGGK